MTTHTETLNVLDEIESLVSDQLQVVSYKWLSRNFSLSSKTAKRLLKDFVEKHVKDLEVVYTVSGWRKNKPSDYYTRLVSSSKLSEVEKEFNGKYFAQVYSVQASIPMDPAAIWNTEFVQAEELFKEPSLTNNCLRDNRFCGISNSFVKRDIEGATVNVTAPPPTKSARTKTAPAQDQSVKEKPFPLPANNKNGQSEKSVTGTGGGSLKNMWGRVPVKTEDDSATIELKNHDHSEPQKPSHDAEKKRSSDDETRDVDFGRASKNDNRKRKVIFDFSDDECEDVISLASPTSPKIKPCPESEQTKDSVPEKPDVARASREMKTNEAEVSEEVDRPKIASADTCAVRKKEKSMASPMEKVQDISSEAEVKPSKGRNSEAPSSPKRKKVLKTRIDDRGREVTEVVWEEKETDVKKKEDTDTSKKLNDGKSSNTVNRADAQKKSPAMGNAAATKAGSKKGGNAKDPKQGNIMSFFKRV